MGIWYNKKNIYQAKKEYLFDIVQRVCVLGWKRDEWKRGKVRFCDACAYAREDGVMPAEPAVIRWNKGKRLFSEVKWNSGQAPLRRIDSVVYLRKGVFQ